MSTKNGVFLQEINSNLTADGHITLKFVVEKIFL